MKYLLRCKCKRKRKREKEGVDDAEIELVMRKREPAKMGVNTFVYCKWKQTNKQNATLCVRCIR